MIIQQDSSYSTLRKPARLKANDTIGLICPASAIPDPKSVRVVTEQMAVMGLNVKTGAHLLDRYGYLAGRDEDRAADVNAMFADPTIKGIMAIRGGWGCNRILPLLNYELIRKNPKVVLGYSDVTALLTAIYTKSDLVTFHGPMGVSTWGAYTLNYIKQMLFDGDIALLQNPSTSTDHPCSAQNSIETITPGITGGKLVGGNLAVLSAMVGSEFLPDWRGKILFLEDIREAIYRVDRMLTQLKLAGILNQISGFIFGHCTDCHPGEPACSFTLMEVLSDHLRPLGIPAWHGSLIGHIPDQFTLPIGTEVEIDADKGTILMLEQAVV